MLRNALTLAAVTVLTLTTNVSADTITITQNAGGSTGILNWGQSFMPNVNDGYGPVPTTVYLEEFTLFKTAYSGEPTGVTPVTLNIYTSFDFGASAPTGPVLGTSTNAIDWDDLAGGGAATFTFASLALDYDTKYYAALSETRGIQFDGDVYGGGSLGLLHSAGNFEGSNDAQFNATFNTVIPEPASLAIVLGGALMLCRRRD